MGDALAISIGNAHLQESAEGAVDRELLGAIESVVSIPLVLHGGSGLSHALRADLAATTHV